MPAFVVGHRGGRLERQMVAHRSIILKWRGSRRTIFLVQSKPTHHRSCPRGNRGWFLRFPPSLWQNDNPENVCRGGGLNVVEIPSSKRVRLVDRTMFAAWRQRTPEGTRGQRWSADRPSRRVNGPDGTRLSSWETESVEAMLTTLALSTSSPYTGYPGQRYIWFESKVCILRGI
ncbi:hypothetical protein C8J57DRAFT_1220282 [Mycena rebaudengoi]|nr:hypothetical protein C8J57DRAFT_1220282 [Mycena rebaudengoi]